MEKPPETALARRVKERLAALDKKAAPLAKSLGYGDSFIRDIVRKGVMPGAEKLARLAISLQTTPDYLLGKTNDLNSESIDVPLIGWISAGAMMREDLADEALGHITVSDLPVGDWIALEVRGDSMDRISPPESKIFIDRTDKHLVPNALYVIADPEGNATYKRYRPGPPMRFEPVSTNPANEPIFPDQEPLIVGRVKRSVLDAM